MHRTLAVLALAAAALTGACGGGGGSNSSEAYCRQLRSSAAEAAKTTTTRNTSSSSTTIDYSALQTRFDKALNKISSKAPAELSDDYTVLKQYFDLYLTALKNPDKADRAKLQQLAPKYTAAQKKITDYNTNVCKFTPTTNAPATTTTAAPATTTTAKKK
jgi:hypothetical protein